MPPRLVAAMARSGSSGPEERPRAPVRAALLAVVVLGIVGMHGLAAHCPPATETTSAPHHGVSTSPHHADDAGQAASSLPASPLGDVFVGASDHDTVVDLCMVGACVTALAGLGWILAMARARANRAWWRAPLLRHLARPRPRPRLLRPPTLAELSLLRC